MEKQYIYIFSNSKNTDLVKVGYTTKHPTARAESLSKQTGAIGTFNVEWYLEVPDGRVAEVIAHYKLKRYHTEKEYFNIEPFIAVIKLEDLLIEFFEINNTEIQKYHSGKVEESLATQDETYQYLKLKFEKIKLP
jgi:T5orf172 domain